MVPKQQEMDGIVQSLFESMVSKAHLKSTLLVLCGDHGMNDAGNHGASSPGETSPALVFVSPKLKTISSKLPAPAQPKGEFEYYSMVEQSDIAPTIAALLGFPVSKNNLGAFIPDFLPFWPKTSDQIQILIRNARQILNIVTAAFGGGLFDTESATDPCALESSEINDLACQWQKIDKQARFSANAKELDQEWLIDMSEWLRRAQDLMSSMASNYDMPRLFLGQGVALASAVTSGIAVLQLGSHRGGLLAPLVLITVTYGIMMFASSYVEEEQHFWYWSSTIWIAYLGVRHVRRSTELPSMTWFILALAALRVTRGWNQTGQKFAGEPDIVKTYVVPNPQLLWITITVAYIMLSFRILSRLDSLPYFAATSLASLLLTSAFSFKMDFTSEDAPELVIGFAHTFNQMFQGQSLLWKARTVFGLLATLWGKPIPSSLHPDILFHALQVANLSIPEITTASILLQHASFFAFGGSNAISSVDLSSAYNGVSGFNIVAVGLLTLVSNWAGSIFWVSATNLMLLRKYHEGHRRVFRQHLAVMTFFFAASVVFVMAACTVLRTHLFIWTVFSPKYLYSMAWSLGQHLLINTGFGGLLFWLTAR
ncbi:GPI ethanolamine phosphate transferase 2 [Neonectria ditissima]|uniref:GPI ethanolamine phosphate transferase 2 n=1 Tax=Neonectria ditissima TaxID=78410 RepID=A0A0P7BA35_9HYPO|nr:GPI ethanolamine phosphate transferase 2 [Neonectria ditissima]